MKPYASYGRPFTSRRPHDRYGDTCHAAIQPEPRSHTALLTGTAR